MWFRSPGAETTLSTAAALASVVGAEGLVVALVGPLGAGKTVFAKGLARGIGIDPGEVASPTFTIASQYRAPGGRRFAHVDLYRLTSADELDAAGFLDLLVPGAIVAVEWADRFLEALPRDHLRVEIRRGGERAGSGGAAGSPSGEVPRVLDALAFGPIAKASLTRWCDAIAVQVELS